MLRLSCLLLLSLCCCARCCGDTLVVVTMPLCEPCRALKRALKERPWLYGGHTLVVAEGRDSMRRWGVSSVPTMIRLSIGGDEAGRHIGYSSDDDVQTLMK